MPLIPDRWHLPHPVTSDIPRGNVFGHIEARKTHMRDGHRHTFPTLPTHLLRTFLTLSHLLKTLVLRRVDDPNRHAVDLPEVSSSPKYQTLFLVHLPRIARGQLTWLTLSCGPHCTSCPAPRCTSTSSSLSFRRRPPQKYKFLPGRREAKHMCSVHASCPCEDFTERK